MLDVRRREFITLLGGAVAWPLAAHAEQGRMKRVGVLVNGAEADPEIRGGFRRFGNSSNSSDGRRAATSGSSIASRRTMRSD
jgi:putative ABC transport system substrate-binding protein